MTDKAQRTALVRNAHYRRLLAARFVSNLGNGMTPIALAFGILDLAGTTPTSLSLVLAAQAVPLVLFLPIGGVVADRLGRARVVGVTDIVLSGFIFLMAALFLTGQVTIPILMAIMVVYGTLAALWYPAMGGLLPDVVPDEHIQPANAFISVANNGGLIVGAAVGGVLVATLGAGLAIGVDALSFLIAGLLVFSFRRVSSPSGSEESMLGDLTHGWRVFTSYKWVVVVVVSFSVVVMSWRGSQEVLGPVLAKEFYGGAAGWATFMAFEGAGMLAGGLIASRIRPRRPMVFGMLITLALPIVQLMLAFALPLPTVVVGAFVLGVALELFYVIWMVALQTHIPREALSRVNAYDAMGSLMLGPLGLALAGPLVAWIGIQGAFILAAVVSTVPIVVSLFFRSLWSLKRAVPHGSAVSTAQPGSP